MNINNVIARTITTSQNMTFNNFTAGTTYMQQRLASYLRSRKRCGCHDHQQLDSHNSNNYTEHEQP